MLINAVFYVFHVFTKIRMKGDVFAIFSDELSVEDISSIILSYHEQELHFLSLRIDFLKSKMTPKMVPKTVKIPT